MGRMVTVARHFSWLILASLTLSACLFDDKGSDDDDDDDDAGESGQAGESGAGRGGSGGSAGAAVGGGGGSVGGVGGSLGGSSGGTAARGGSSATGGTGGSTGGTGGSTGGTGGSTGGTGGSTGGSSATGGTGGSTGGTGGSTGGTGGSTGGAAGSGAQAGASGGTAVDLAEKEEACAILATCTDCCVTVGVYALDSASDDATEEYVTLWEYDGAEAAANFSFSAATETGAIFFKLAAEETIDTLGVTASSTETSLEVVLVRASGEHGCIYDIVGDYLYPVPTSCWGDGAGPYYGTPVDQIEVRLRADGSGPARLTVSALAYDGGA